MFLQTAVAQHTNGHRPRLSPGRKTALSQLSSFIEFWLHQHKSNNAPHHMREFSRFVLRYLSPEHLPLPITEPTRHYGLKSGAYRRHSISAEPLRGEMLQGWNYAVRLRLPSSSQRINTSSSWMRLTYSPMGKLRSPARKSSSRAYISGRRKQVKRSVIESTQRSRRPCCRSFSRRSTKKYRRDPNRLAGAPESHSARRAMFSGKPRTSPLLNTLGKLTHRFPHNTPLPAGK